jgi:4-hydroxy-2-oxoheptanedioate aldolase
LLCQAENADAVRAFVEGCRYPHHSAGVDPGLPSAVERLHGAEPAVTQDGLGIGTRGRGSEATAAPIWGLSAEEYLERCEPWPLDLAGELLLGVKLESPEGIAQCEAILAVPGLGFAELGPGDLGLSLGYVAVPREPYPAEMREARERVFAACRKNRVAFLETASPETITAKLDEGVRVIAGHREETAQLGRAHQRRSLPV